MLQSLSKNAQYRPCLIVWILLVFKNRCNAKMVIPKVVLLIKIHTTLEWLTKIENLVLYRSMKHFFKNPLNKVYDQILSINNHSFISTIWSQMLFLLVKRIFWQPINPPPTLFLFLKRILMSSPCGVSYLGLLSPHGL